MQGQTRWVALVSAGFGLALSLNAFTLWGIEDLLSTASSWPWAAGDMRSFCLPANVLTFLAYALASLRSKRIARHRPVIAACSLLASGAVALVAACLASSPDLPLFQIAGTLLGAGGALAFICWELTFAAAGTDRARKAILLASALSTVPYLLLTFLARQALVYAIAALLVPSCIASLIAAGRLTSGPRPVPDPPEGAGALGSLWSGMWAPLACVMMTGVVGPSIGAFATLGTMSDALRCLLYQFANIAAVLVLALCWFRLNARPTIEAVFLTLVPIAAVVLFLFPFWSHGYQGFVVTFGCFIFSLASILMMMLCIDLSRAHRVEIGVVYGFFATGTYLAQILGASLGTIVGTSPYPRSFQVVAVVALLLWGLSALGIVALGRQRARYRDTQAQAQDGGARAGSEKEAEGQDGRQEAARPAGTELAARCSALAARHGLSPRELEVLELIGRGRDVNAMADILGVSRNTVRTHVQRLYADLDVHTRQDLIDLIERTAAQTGRKDA